MTEPTPDAGRNESYTEYLTTLCDRIATAQNYARENLIKAKERSKKYYDRRANPCNFRVGDEVYLSKEPTKDKLSDQYVGPYIIESILPYNNVKIRINVTKTRIVHSDKIKMNRPRGGGLIPTDEP